jgi:hypothetical protein
MYGGLIESFKTTIEEIGSKLEKGEEPFKKEEKSPQKAAETKTD